MNEATQDMRDYARVQMWMVGIGTAAVVATLWFALIANWAARDAVTVTREMGMAQVRAHLAISNIQIHPLEKWPHIEAKFKLKNTGLTQTRELKYSAGIFVGLRSVLDPQMTPMWEIKRDLEPGETEECSYAVIALSDVDRPPDTGEQVSFSVKIILTYQDIFNASVTDVLRCDARHVWQPGSDIVVWIDDRRLYVKYDKSRDPHHGSAPTLPPLQIVVGRPGDP